MISAVYQDGKRPVQTSVCLEIDEYRLVVTQVDAREVITTWALEDILIEKLQRGRARLSRLEFDDRLVIDSQNWAALRTDPRFKPVSKRARQSHAGLVISLVLGSLAVVAFILFGVPPLAGDLARLTPAAYEQKIGRSLEFQVKHLLPACSVGKAGAKALDAMGQRIASGADIPFPVKVRASGASMVNAFALPGGTVIVTDELIQLASGPEELSAVLAHEIAHVQRRHVMQGLYQSLGAGLLLDALVGGGTGVGQQAVLLSGTLNELSFTRKLEAEADTYGMKMLHANGYATTGMASFFKKLDVHEADQSAIKVDMPSWVLSHPKTDDRAEAASRNARPGKPVVTPAEWQAIRQGCGAEG